MKPGTSTTREAGASRVLHLNGRAALLAGTGAGTLFLLMEMITTFAFDAGSLFGPAHVTLQGFIGAEQLPGHYNPGLVLAGLFLHYCLSVLVVVPLAFFIHPWTKRYLVVAVGFVYGYVLYFINFFLFAIMLPMLATARDVFMLVDYTLFGILAAWFYIALRDRAVRRGR